MPWVMVAMSIFGAIQGYRAGEEMEDLAREEELLADKNALLADRELQEQVRRQEKEDTRLRGRARARAAASGAEISSGSLATALEYQEEEQGRQLNWMKTAGASRIRLQLQGDKLRAKAGMIKASNQKWSSLFQGFGSAAGYADKGGLFASTSSSYAAPGFERR